MLRLQPITYREAAEFVTRHHRHNVAPRGQKFAIAVNNGERVVGVAVAGRPIARHQDDGYTLEVLRVCVLDGFPNACSKLYAACWRAGRAMGYRRAITYCREDESGVSVRAAGWSLVGFVRAGSWSRPSRPRVDTTDKVNRNLFSTGGPTLGGVDE